jgi:endonuclease YncB( thermonuclease family)
MLVYLWKRFMFCCRPKPVVDDWKGERHLVKIASVYDGDTITVSLVRHGRHLVQKVRLTGYDTPEMKPLMSDPNRDKEKSMAYKAREDLLTQMQEYMWLVCDGREKFGRILGTLYRTSMCGSMEKTSVNEWMLKNSFAYAYEGGTKATWSK